MLELAANERIASGAGGAAAAATGLEAGAMPLTLDGRAISTYELLGVDHRLVA